jgi:hypothetical protein
MISFSIILSFVIILVPIFIFLPVTVAFVLFSEIQMFLGLLQYR